MAKDVSDVENHQKGEVQQSHTALLLMATGLKQKGRMGPAETYEGS